jgi:23S rRNA (pseudouridine1915-N3)-methyltransferase
VKLCILAIGRLRHEEAALCDRYLQRINQLSRMSGLGPMRVVEIVEGRGQTAAVRMSQEAADMLRRLPAGHLLVALEERGQSLTSDDFARLLADWRDAGQPGVSFALGGADGHAPVLRESAGLCLSLSSMTFPHGLARVVLMEQLYRAATMLAGHPYHRA